MKRACVSKPALFIDPLVDLPQRQPKIWTERFDTRPVNCKCPDYLPCSDIQSLNWYMYMPRVTGAVDYYCRDFAQGDIIQCNGKLHVFERIIQWEGTPRTQQRYHAWHELEGDEDNVLYTALILFSWNEMLAQIKSRVHSKAAHTRFIERQCKRRDTTTFVLCLLKHLGFSRDLRRYIAQRVFKI